MDEPIYYLMYHGDCLMGMVDDTMMMREVRLHSDHEKFSVDMSAEVTVISDNRNVNNRLMFERVSE